MHSIEASRQASKAVLGTDVVAGRYNEHMEGCYTYYDARQEAKKERRREKQKEQQQQEQQPPRNNGTVVHSSIGPEVVADGAAAEDEPVEEEEGAGGAAAAHECDSSEQYRIEMNKRQPASSRNYTNLGYAKIRAPAQVYRLLKDFWDANRHASIVERWHEGQIYVNHWDVPSLMVPLENSTLTGGGDELRQHLWDAARTTLETWTGQRQVECSLYGIRIYQRGALLVPHVDRAPLVASAIINVDQDVDEPWPLEVIGHDGVSRNVTMLPGDMVLYESHSVLHGRPYPLQGNFMANVFIHFEPIGPLKGELEYNGILPPYIVDGTPDAEHWRLQHPEGHKLMSNRHGRMIAEDGAELLTAHHLAADLNGSRYDELVVHLDANPGDVIVRDGNGWTALAEAIRTGHVRTVQLLLERGSAPNAKIGPNGEAGSLLWLAIEEWGENHEVVQLLQQWNATVVEPDPGVVVEGIATSSQEVLTTTTNSEQEGEESEIDEEDEEDSEEEHEVEVEEEEDDDDKDDEQYFEGYEEYEDDEEEDADDESMEDGYDNDSEEDGTAGAAHVPIFQETAKQLLLDEDTPRSQLDARSDEL
jgi:prolyl 4-hydroxylase